MADFVTLTCPSCGGKLQITNDLECFACGYCGVEQVVRRAGGVISLAPLVESVQQVKAGVDRTASELAIKRLQLEISTLRQNRSSMEGSWKGSNYSRGCLMVWIPLLLAGLIIAIALGNNTPIPLTGYIFLVLALIVGVFMYRLVGNQQQKEQIKWDQLDILISAKEEELSYHQAVVSRLD